MTDDDTTPTAAQLTRRDTLRSGGALASLLGGGVTHDLAGGPAADAMSEFRVPYYRVPEPDLDSPGVVGRRVEITAGGATYETGDQLVDTGSSWERISAGVGSLNTGQAEIETGSATNNSLVSDLSRSTVSTPLSGKHQHTALVDTGDKIIYFYRESSDHLPSSGDTLRAIDSLDYGETWENDREIFGPEAGLQPFDARVLDDGKIAVFVVDYDNSPPHMIYSSDDGDTWSETEIDIAGGGKRFAVRLNRYPSSVGGADDGGYIAFFHRDGSPNDIVATTTTDNGDTWQDQGQIIGGGQLPTSKAMEPCAERVGSADKWVMVIRDNEGGNALITKSTDLFNWDDPIDSGVPLGSNYPLILYHNGLLHWFTASRPYFITDSEIQNYGNALLYQNSPAIDVYEDLTTWGSWSVLNKESDNGGIYSYNDFEIIGGRLYLSGGGNGGDDAVFYHPTKRLEDGSQLSSKNIIKCEHQAGATPDERLSSALKKAEDGQKILLEIGQYTDDRTVTTRLDITGPADASTEGTIISDATWDLDDFLISLERLRLDNGAVVNMNMENCKIRDTTNELSNNPATINVNADRCRIYDSFGGDVVFASDVSDGVVSSGCISMDVTDNNGGNTDDSN